MPTIIPASDERLTWAGVISLQREGAAVTPWRLPVERLQLYPFEDLQATAAMPAGVRISFRSDTSSISCRFGSTAEGVPARIDLCIGGDLLASAPLAGRDRVEFNGLPAGDKRLDLWLPQGQPFRFEGLELDDGVAVSPCHEESPRWLTYGSSITQCLEAASPARTWPALVARGAGLNLTCLGYSGQCHIEPMLARMIRDRPAELISLCLGINVHGGASLSLRTFRPAVIGFISTVREHHRMTPLALISPIYCRDRETLQNEVGMNLQLMRREIRAAVQALQELGDENLHYVDGLSLLAEEDAHLLPDGLHPNQEGYELMAERFIGKVLPRLIGGRSSVHAETPAR